MSELEFLVTNRLFVEFQADVETDEVYAQMTLQPLTPVFLTLLMFLSQFYTIFPPYSVLQCLLDGIVNFLSQ